MKLKVNAEQAEPTEERLFFGIVYYSSALAFGGVLASLQALSKDASGFTFHISLGTFAAFAVGFAGVLGYWRIMSHHTAHGKSLLARVSSLLLLLGGVAAFLYPLRFLPLEKIPEVLTGLAAAAAALSTVALMLLQLKKFFDRDEKRAEDDQGASLMDCF